MDEVYDEHGVTVFDNVLGDSQFLRLRQWSETVRYQGVHHQQWRTVWRHGEGEPLRGPNWITSSAIDDDHQLPAALQPLASVLKGLVRPRDKLLDITLTPWIYARGTALGLHRDAGRYDGSYIYYSVPEWDVHWGGLLHALHEPVDAARTPRGVLDLSAERTSTGRVGRGDWISPAPNRLVLIAPFVRHFVSRVDVNAGDRPRTSIAGFFELSENSTSPS